MNAYITLVKFTDTGMSKIGMTTERNKDLFKVAKKLGAKILSCHWTMGSYDMVVVLQAKDSATASAVVLSMSQKGNVITSTMPAFSAEEMNTIVGKL